MLLIAEREEQAPALAEPHDIFHVPKLGAAVI
jgi:hypothetical protein